MSLWQQLTRYRKHNHGSVSIEFALIAPILLLLYVGTIELGAYMDASRKTIHANRLIADLIAQQPVITKKLFTDMEFAMAEIMAPIPTDGDNFDMVITSINGDPNATDSGIVSWSYSINPGGKKLAVGSTVTLPADMDLSPQSSVILAESTLHYHPAFQFVMKAASYELKDRLYTWPRSGIDLPCDDCD